MRKTILHFAVFGYGFGVDFVRMWPCTDAVRRHRQIPLLRLLPLHRRRLLLRLNCGCSRCH